MTSFFSKRSVSVILGVFLLVAPISALAADVRGRVDTGSPNAGYPYPLPHAQIFLYAWDGRDWVMAARTVTDANGMYYFRGLNPGTYLIQVLGQNFQISISREPFQDIPPILIQRF